MIVNEKAYKNSNNTSGYTGVYWRRDINKWWAKVTVDYDTFSLGVFNTKVEAICHRVAAEQCLGFKNPQEIPRT